MGKQQLQRHSPSVEARERLDRLGPNALAVDELLALVGIAGARSAFDHRPEWFAVVESVKTFLATTGKIQFDIPTPLRDAVIAERLEALALFHGEPVRPLKELCPAVAAWLRGKLTPIFEANHPGTVLSVQFDIGKSNLLWRLLYGGEKVRTKKCPLHNGRWYGIEDDCPHKCDGTGWLREP